MMYLSHIFCSQIPLFAFQMAHISAFVSPRTSQQRIYHAIDCPGRQLLFSSAVEDFSEDFMSQPNDDKFEEVQTYKNRSVLLEYALKQKLAALHLNDQKLLVLQDAAKRVIERNQKEYAENHRIAATKHCEESAQYQEKYEHAEMARQVAEKSLRDSNQKWSSACDERDAVKEELKTLKLSFTNRVEDIKAQAENQLRIRLKAEEKLHQNSVSEFEDVSNSLKHTQSLLATARQRILTKNRHIETMEKQMKTHQSEIHSLQVDLKSSQREIADNDDAPTTDMLMLANKKYDQLVVQHKALEDAMAEMVVKNRDTVVIAEAAVAAAQRREAKANREHDAIRRDNEALMQELKSVKQNLASMHETSEEKEISVEAVPKIVEQQLASVAKHESFELEEISIDAMPKVGADEDVKMPTDPNIHDTATIVTPIHTTEARFRPGQPKRSFSADAVNRESFEREEISIDAMPKVGADEDVKMPTDPNLHDTPTIVTPIHTTETRFRPGQPKRSFSADAVDRRFKPSMQLQHEVSFSAKRGIANKVVRSLRPGGRLGKALNSVRGFLKKRGEQRGSIHEVTDF